MILVALVSGIVGFCSVVLDNKKAPLQNKEQALPAFEQEVFNQMVLIQTALKEAYKAENLQNPQNGVWLIWNPISFHKPLREGRKTEVLAEIQKRIELHKQASAMWLETLRKFQNGEPFSGLIE